MLRRACALAFALPFSLVAFADEGMWTLDNPPQAFIKQRYGVELSSNLLGHLQHAAVSFGASASFVSKNGLMLTNHHVALSCIAKLSNAQRDLQAHGFVAKSPVDELPCPGSVARVLVSSEDVTAQVLGPAANPAGDEAANSQRKATIAALEAECSKQSGLHCEMVSLYQGSVYQLYRYKEWSDVRLAFAPEYQAAFFGGDDDNFVYPRFALDFALFRVYENGKPVQPADYLKLAATPVAEGDAIFVLGHPHRTDRTLTMAQLETLRTATLPIRIASEEGQQAMLHAYSERSSEAARQALDTLFSVENHLKAERGELATLKDAASMARKEADEVAFRADYAKRGLKDDPWATVATAAALEARHAKELWAVGYGSRTLFEMAGRLVEQAYERQLPEGQRLADYGDSEWPAIERKLKANVPLYKDLEIARSAFFFAEARQLLGEQHAFVRTVLGDAGPEAVAEKAIRGTTLDRAEVRAALLKGGVKAIEASDDPLIRLARAVYPLRRALMQLQEEQIDAPTHHAAEQLGHARFALYGKVQPPDATGTLRLSYGKVAGYRSGGVATPWKTTFGGLLARADSFDDKGEFKLAEQLDAKRSSLDTRLPLDFVTTADIIGGNSGSPVVNAKGEWVGLIFDSNLESLGGRFIYTDDTARSLAVDSQAILHALDRVYGAPALASEIKGS